MPVLDTVLGIEQGYRWVWATAAARAAQPVTASQIGAVGYQTDIAREYVLLGVSPMRWGERPDPTVGWPRTLIATHNTASLTAVGVSGLITPSGTIAARSLAGAAANRGAQLPRLAIKSAATAGSYLLMRTQGGTSNPYPGTGFRIRFVFLVTAVTADMRWAFGLGFYNGFTGAAQSPVTQLAASSLASLSVIVDVGDSNASVLSSGTSGAYTKTDLGVAFPARTVDVGYIFDVYTRDGLTYGWQVENVNTSAVTSGVSSGASAPPPTLNLSWGVYATNGATAAEVSMDYSEVTLANVLR